MALAVLFTASGTTTSLTNTDGLIRFTATEGALFDDFTGPANTRPNPAIWGYDYCALCRDELETYGDAIENARLDGAGNLVIQAHRTPTGPTPYTSAEVTSKGKAVFGYGTVSARIKFPSGQGLLPAFWMVGGDCDVVVGWPDCGEIDIIELPNVDTAFHSTLIGPGGKRTSVAAEGPTGMRLSEDFHTYWVHRAPDRVTFGIDDVTNAVFTPQSLPPGGQWVFNKPMFALLNIAVGNPWTGPPDASTVFPATMVVDWFRYAPD